MAEVCIASDLNIQRAASLIQQGEIVAFPTETVYGLGANALNAEAVRKIFIAKGRPPSNPLIVHLSSVSYLTQVCDIEDSRLDEIQLEKLFHFWPGPLSLVVPKHKDIPMEVTAGGDTVAVRIPDHPVAKKLIQLSGCPLAAPSANLTNSVSPTLARHVQDSLADRIPMILDGGPCRVGVESTVVSLLGGKPKILRPGGIPREHLEEVLGCKLDRCSLMPEQGVPKPSPGMLEKHYSPSTPLTFRDQIQGSLRGKIGYIGFQASDNDSTSYSESRILSTDGSLEHVARHLFGALRDLDDMGLDHIVVDSCSLDGLGEAIMDRLSKASVK